jgi:hypothetical protein
MDNQHRKIIGYRDLSQEEIDLMNAVKEVEQQMLAYVSTVQTLIQQQIADAETANVTLRHRFAEPQRWASIAKTHIQEGASALVRAIAQPT